MSPDVCIDVMKRKALCAEYDQYRQLVDNSWTISSGSLHPPPPARNTYPYFSREVFWPPDSHFSVSFQPYLKVEKKFPLLVWSKSGQCGTSWRHSLSPAPHLWRCIPWRVWGSFSCSQGRISTGVGSQPPTPPSLPSFSLLFTSFSSAGHVSHSSGPLK